MAEDTQERETPRERAARREREHAEKQHRDDRAALRSREQARREESEEDHRRFREREIKRRQRYGDDFSGLSNLVRDADWFAHSVSRAGTRAVFGTVKVLEDLVLNLTDSYYAVPRADEVTDEDDADDRDRPRTSRTLERYRSTLVRCTSFFYDDLSQAIRDQADVLVGAVNEFSSTRADEEGEGEDEDGKPHRTRSRRGKSTAADHTEASSA